MSASFLGLRTAIYAAPDLAKTKEWYASLLGIEPYFDEPFYVGFSVGGYELGLDPDLTSGAGTPVVYWGVDDIQETWNRLMQAGADEVEAPHEVGSGIWVAIVRDPFGNTLGIIRNPHFKADQG